MATINKNNLHVLGFGTYLPPKKSKVKDLALTSGGNPDIYDSWESIHVAEGDDHPSTMGHKALTNAMSLTGISGQDLDMVLYTGVSRDYLPSWSVAHAIMNLTGASSKCTGMDLSVGCLGILFGLELLQGWFASRPQGYAAIVSAERWSNTVNKADNSSAAIWGHSDGAGAIIVGPGTQSHLKKIGVYKGSSLISDSNYNDLIRIKYGGTRNPIPPSFDQLSIRELKAVPSKEVYLLYEKNYTHVAGETKQAMGESGPSWIVCNQVSPRMIDIQAKIWGVAKDQVVNTGMDSSHIGGADIAAGFLKLHNAGKLSGKIGIVSSAVYGWGSGYVEF